MPGLDDYGGFLRSASAAVPDYATQEANQQMVALRRAQAQAQLAEVTDKLAQRKAFGDDVTSVLSDPNPKNVSALILKHPEYAEQIKSGWDVRDKAAKQTDLTQLGEIYSAGSVGKWDVAAKAARSRFEADKAAGQADPTEEHIVNALESSDPAERNAAMGMIGVQLASATGAEHFGTVYGNLKGDYTLDQGAARFDRSGGMIAHSPFIKDGEGNIRLWNDTAGAPPADGSTPAPAEGAPPASPVAATEFSHLTGPAQAVATTLSAANLPAPVIAGFLGNFHIEDGYLGARGDGGVAGGIAQWHPDRQANFERVVGKPVSQASPEEQAGFVLHEMQNPEEAGMTVGQRDAILAAKTPAQAAGLIDQFYERSNGKHRAKRMAAASTIAGGVTPPVAGSPAAAGSERFPIAIPGKGRDAPSGFEWTDASRTTLRPIAGGPSDQQAEGLDAPTVGFYAQQILAGGQMPTLGMGKSAAAARQQIMTEVARQARSLGLNGKDLATQQAHFKNATAALKVLETQAGTIEANENTAIANGQQFLDRSRELSAQTRFPIVNAATQAYLRHTGDPTIAAADAAWNTFATEYAKVIAGSPSGAGVLSDSARHEAMSIMRGNYSVKQKEAAFAQMQKDMSNRMGAIRGGIAHGYRNMSVVPGSTREIKVNSDLPKGAKVVGTYQGKRVIEVNGRRMVEQ